MSTILLAEDALDLADAIDRERMAERYRVTRAAGGARAVHLWKKLGCLGTTPKRFGVWGTG